MGISCLKIIKEYNKKWKNSIRNSTEILKELRTLGIWIKLVMKEEHSTLSVKNLNIFEFA
jgi:hypothetical protein